MKQFNQLIVNLWYEECVAVECCFTSSLVQFHKHHPHQEQDQDQEFLHFRKYFVRFAQKIFVTCSWSSWLWRPEDICPHSLPWSHQPQCSRPWSLPDPWCWPTGPWWPWTPHHHIQSENENSFQNYFRRILMSDNWTGDNSPPFTHEAT